MKDDMNWLAELAGGTLRRSAFYREVFESMEEIGKYYPAKTGGWGKRTKSYWLARLADGDKEQNGLNILERKKGGRQGAVYYKWHPLFLARLNGLWKRVKKDL